MPAARPLPAAPVGPPAQLVRLWVVPIVTSVLFAGGVYWIRQLPAGNRPYEQNGIVQVQLVRTPQPPRLQPPAAPEPAADAGQHTEPPMAASPPASNDDTTTVPPARAVARLERAPASVTPVPTAVRNFSSNVAQTFQRALQQHIARYKDYPGQARAARLQGVVQLVFAMRRDGALLDVWVKSSSGYPVLDQAAIDAVRRAEPLPRIPAELPDRLTILYPFAFDGPS